MTVLASREAWTTLLDTGGGANIGGFERGGAQAAEPTGGGGGGGGDRNEEGGEDIKGGCVIQVLVSCYASINST